ncbi:hypothetical protein ScPMuIL_001483 [Solemya velum]
MENSYRQKHTERKHLWCMCAVWAIWELGPDGKTCITLIKKEKTFSKAAKYCEEIFWLRRSRLLQDIMTAMKTNGLLRKNKERKLHFQFGNHIEKIKAAAWIGAEFDLITRELFWIGPPKHIVLHTFFADKEPNNHNGNEYKLEIRKRGWNDDRNKSLPFICTIPEYTQDRCNDAGGRCQEYPKEFCNVTIGYALCDVANEFQCCKNPLDNGCHATGGRCQDSRNIECKIPGGAYRKGLCHGAWYNKCCTADLDNGCEAKGGTCQDKTKDVCKDGSYVKGLCHGPENIQCCLKRICSKPILFHQQQESGCKNIGCRSSAQTMDGGGGGSLSCGYFQIKEAYYKDCGSPGRGWKKCSRDLACATSCVQAYMLRYANRNGCTSNCQSVARLHNGGPNGCQNPTTLNVYWPSVKKHGCDKNS